MLKVLPKSKHVLPTKVLVNTAWREFPMKPAVGLGVGLETYSYLHLHVACGAHKGTIVRLG